MIPLSLLLFSDIAFSENHRDPTYGAALIFPEGELIIQIDDIALYLREWFIIADNPLWFNLPKQLLVAFPKKVRLVRMVVVPDDHIGGDRHCAAFWDTHKTVQICGPKSKMECAAEMCFSSGLIRSKSTRRRYQIYSPQIAFLEE